MYVKACIKLSVSPSFLVWEIQGNSVLGYKGYSWYFRDLYLTLVMSVAEARRIQLVNFVQNKSEMMCEMPHFI